MEREEKILLAIEKGYTYDPETGLIKSKTGRLINGRHNKGYVKMAIWGKNRKCHNLLAHHFAWYWVNKECVELIDHINEDKADNRIYNLRSADKSINAVNVSNRKGFIWVKEKNKFKAQFKSKHIGYYNTQKEAIEAYERTKKEYLNGR